MTQTDITFRRQQAELDEFKRLNHELEFKTQLMLGAIDGGHLNTIDQFHASLAAYDSDEAERAIIQAILRRHGLIEFDGAELVATAKCRRYVESGDRAVRMFDLHNAPPAPQQPFDFRPLPVAY